MGGPPDGNAGGWVDCTGGGVGVETVPVGDIEDVGGAVEGTAGVAEGCVGDEGMPLD